jgi:polyhydroxyalkanoate synthesis repressor PhaR
MSKERLIKKYPNRRLYDTKESRYITLDEVRKMVLDEIQFKVVDRQSGNDITRNILLQIIMEQESGGKPLFNLDILSRFIRHYGDNTQQGFSQYLEQTLQFFTEQQSALRNQMGDAFSNTPIDYWAKWVENNLKIWQEMQQNLSNVTVAPNKEEK